MAIRKARRHGRHSLLNRTKWTVVVLAVLAASPARAQTWECQHIEQITFEECTVLERVFTETNGLNWLRSSGWLRSNQPCAWYGITCRSTAWPRPVIRIDLSDNNLTGNLPGELSLLTELRELRIDNSGPGLRKKKLAGILPTTLGMLAKLEVLVLSENAFDGTIPPELQQLSSLRTLKLDGNAFTGPIPEQLSSLSGLEELSLAGNMLAGRIPAALASLESLRHLNLSNNLLGGSVPSVLGTLAELRSLDLSRNDLSGPLPTSLAMLNYMHRLSLANNRLEGPLTLSLASFASGVNACLLEGNQLCLPDAPPYASLGGGPVCGLPPNKACSVCQGIAEIPTGECHALEAAYETMRGREWKITVCANKNETDSSLI